MFALLFGLGMIGVVNRVRRIKHQTEKSWIPEAVNNAVLLAEHSLFLVSAAGPIANCVFHKALFVLSTGSWRQNNSNRSNPTFR